MSPPSRASGAFDVVLLLDALATVDYLVVGGVAATLHGSPRLTMDLDIVPSSAPDNVDRLATALAPLTASIREPGGRELPADHQLLHQSASAPHGGQLRLRTQYGPLDILWRLHDGRDYADLLPRSVVLSDAQRQVRVVDIDALIDIKTAAGRARDLDDVAILQHIRSRSR